MEEASSEGKVCLQCKQWYPFSQFRKDSSRKDGLRVYCRTCQNKQNYTWRKNNPEKERATQKRYCQSHSKERTARGLKWQKNNPEKAKVLQERTRKKNHEKILERNRAYRQAHTEECRERVRKWRKENPARRRDQEHKRRAQKNGGGGNHTIEQWKELCAKYDHRCLCCKEQKPLVRDHIIPIVQGGSNDISNIQPLCRSCNCKKWAKHIDYRGSYDAS